MNIIPLRIYNVIPQEAGFLIHRKPFAIALSFLVFRHLEMYKTLVLYNVYSPVLHWECNNPVLYFI